MTASARDYSLIGPESDRAFERGLAEGTWFQANVDPERMRQLTERRNLRPLIDALVWLGLIVGFGVLAWSLRGSWWAVPAFIAYAAVAGGAADARWHESGHGTAFRTPWLNDLVYYPASFLLARSATFWRWSHFRHHTDTIVVGRDAEIVFPRPPSVGRLAWTFTHIQGGGTLMWTIVKYAFGWKDPVVDLLVPETDRRRVAFEARIYVAIWAAVVVWAVATTSFYPLLLLGGPTIYGGWLVVFFGVTQHAGLQEDVLDHRYSTRTVLMNPLFRFLYLNMNYHVEHHMFPAVPYYNLPALHREIRDQLAPPAPSTVAAYREIVHAFRHQHDDPSWELDRAVPDVQGRAGHIVQGFEWPETNGVDDGINLGPIAPEPGRSQPIDVGDEHLLLACADDGELFVVARTCTHGDADLAGGAILGCEIECPKHNGRFDLRTGEPTRRPVSVPLQTWSVKLRGEDVVVQTSTASSDSGRST
jgi:fatty acid desaturase/nitrite reductase/ring-hydroxylating ferredoxin subunit